MTSGDEPPLDGSTPLTPSGPFGSTGSGPAEPNPFTRPPGHGSDTGARRRILGQETDSGQSSPPGSAMSGSTLVEPRPAHWSGSHDRVVPPFAAPGNSAAALEPSLLERLIEGAYRWRTFLGLGLAGVMTVAIVLAYNTTTDERLDSATGRSTRSSGSAFAGVTPAGPLTASSLVPSSDQQIGSSVDEAAPTTSSVIDQNSSTTVGVTSASATAPAGPTTASTPTSATGAGGTAQSSTSPTTNPASSSTATITSSSVAVPSTTTAASGTTAASATTSSSVPAPRVRLEAENGELLNAARVGNLHPGSSGAGYVGQIVAPESGVRFNLDSTNGGTTPLRIRYAAGKEGDTTGNRYLTLRVNGVDRYTVELVETTDWSTWSDLLGEIELQPGRNTVSLLKAPGDNGFVNLDYIELH